MFHCRIIRQRRLLQNHIDVFVAFACYILALGLIPATHPLWVQQTEATCLSFPEGQCFVRQPYYRCLEDDTHKFDEWQAFCSSPFGPVKGKAHCDPWRKGLSTPFLFLSLLLKNMFTSTSGIYLRHTTTQETRLLLYAPTSYVPISSRVLTFFIHHLSCWCTLQSIVTIIITLSFR